MPNLRQIYDTYWAGESHRRLVRWVKSAASPWSLGEVRIYIEPNYLTMGTDICIRTDLLPNNPCWIGIPSGRILELDEFDMLDFVTREFYRWFLSIHVPSEDNIELGEN